MGIFLNKRTNGKLHYVNENDVNRNLFPNIPEGVSEDFVVSLLPSKEAESGATANILEFSGANANTKLKKLVIYTDAPVLPLDAETFNPDAAISVENQIVFKPIRLVDVLVTSGDGTDALYTTNIYRPHDLYDGFVDVLNGEVGKSGEAVLITSDKIQPITLENAKTSSVYFVVNIDFRSKNYGVYSLDKDALCTCFEYVTTDLTSVNGTEKFEINNKEIIFSLSFTELGITDITAETADTLTAKIKEFIDTVNSTNPITVYVPYEVVEGEPVYKLSDCSALEIKLEDESGSITASAYIGEEVEDTFINNIRAEYTTKIEGTEKATDEKFGLVKTSTTNNVSLSDGGNLQSDEIVASGFNTASEKGFVSVKTIKNLLNACSLISKTNFAFATATAPSTSGWVNFSIPSGFNLSNVMVVSFEYEAGTGEWRSVLGNPAGRERTPQAMYSITNMQLRGFVAEATILSRPLRIGLVKLG